MFSHDLRGCSILTSCCQFFVYTIKNSNFIHWETKMTSFWQQVLALDAKYNSPRCSSNPNFRAMYLKRRSQLLKEAFQNNNVIFKKQYLKIRSLLLQQHYESNNSLSLGFDQTAPWNKSIKNTSKLSPGGGTLPRNSKIVSKSNVLIPTKQAEASRALVGGTTISENYAFVGVHHIFDQHIASVVMIKFANNDKSRLCCASSDGTISLCNVSNDPPTLDIILREHEKAVTSCDWSINNDFVISSSLDCTIRMWDSYSGKCIRVVKDESEAEVLCCIFQPANNNIVIAGNSKGIVYVLKISAGIYPKGGSSKIGGRILSITCDSMGNIVWAGNNKGVITSFQFESETGRLQKRKKILVAENRPITCLSWRAWISREARDPTLLVNCAANVLCLYRIEDSEGNLKLKKKFNVRHRSELLRSTFCPIMSFRQGACIVTGSEDSCVYFIDIEKEEKPVVNKLQGHACPVLGVSFNYDESLLATSDVQGLVIIWKRAT